MWSNFPDASFQFFQEKAIQPYVELCQLHTFFFPRLCITHSLTVPKPAKISVFHLTELTYVEGPKDKAVREMAGLY